jgi:predicted  nucleic acid-binding Zn-ribbon protein
MLPTVVAQFAPLSPAAQLAVVSLLGVIATLVIIWSAIRRKPPVGEDLVQLRGSIDALNRSVETLTKAHERHASHASEIETLKKEVLQLQRQREDDQKSTRAYVAQSNQRIFERIDELADSMSKNSQSVERAIGRIEGKLDAVGR